MELAQWFSTEFNALTGYEPYAWQTVLFSNLVTGEIPKNINLPTGSGKTSVIPVWLLAFIQNPTLPRRLVYVVDRRSVVDQATAVVEKMTTRLPSELQSALSAYSLTGEAPLGISTLRGEFVDNEEWSKLPCRPSVTVGTVDKIGSALMFSSYGDGSYGKARKAGLLGNDTLIIFDECHLVPAFETLLQNVKQAGGKLKAFHAVTMSATSIAQDSLALTEADLANATLSARLNAKKVLKLVDAQSVKVKITSLALAKPPQRTIIYVQSPQTAKEIVGALQEHHSNVACLTGTIRGKERDDLADNPVFKAFTVAEQPAEPHFLVATSAGEVGIDLTCTRCVTEMSGAVSLVQRFGRANRFAESKEAEITVVYKELEVEKFERTADLEFLKSLNGDASCWNLYNKRGELAALTQQKSAIATLEPSVLDVLSMTSLKNDVDISAYLRGKDSNTRYVEIAWREEVPLLCKLSAFDFEAYMKHMRVLSFEKLNETEKQALEVLKAVDDAEVIVVTADAERMLYKLSELDGGDLKDCLLLLPPTVAGLTGGMFSATNTDNAQLDIATLAHKHHEARLRCIGEAPECPKDQKEVFNRGGLIVRKVRDRTRGSKVTIEDHSAEVAAYAKQFAQKCCLSTEVIEALETAGLTHDKGKENPIWQIAATSKMNVPPLAKIGIQFRSPMALAGFRHEFESLQICKDFDELAKHLVASHHAGARPTWCGSRDLAPVQRDCDSVVDQANRFAKLQAEFGWWGLAYIEAILRAADAYTSDELSL